MSDEFEKSKVELKIFREFAERSGLPIVPNSIEKRCPPEPDLLCRFCDGESVAFELKELCSEALAPVISYLLKSGDQNSKYIRDSNPEDYILKKGLETQHVTKHPKEILFYTDGRIGTPPDVLILKMQDICSSISHEFRRVWFMGDPNVPCKCVYSVVDSSEP